MEGVDFDPLLTGSGPTGWGLGMLPPPASLTSVIRSTVSATTQPSVQMASSSGVTSLSGSGQGPQPAVPASFDHATLGPLTASSSSFAYSHPGPSVMESSAASAMVGACLSPGSVPLPAKLVAKVRSGVYVEMKELLGDNIALLSELETFNGPHHVVGVAGANKPRLREISSLASWMYCFLTYLALRCPDNETRERLIYAQLIVRESLRHGGKNWLTYDKVFRQQAALDESLKWNELHPAILASTILSSPQSSVQTMPGRSGTFCTLCQGVDHRADQCALSYLHRSDLRTNGGRSIGMSGRICASWNRGSCRFPAGCSFRHVCRICCQPHPEIHCPSRAGQAPPQTPSHGPVRSQYQSFGPGR